jgi:hypothetical protein
MLIHFRIALYGLFVFYTLTRQELKGRRPLAKFMAIKLIVFATFYQGFVVSHYISTLSSEETELLLVLYSV